mmetsp:Transcript_30652/g.5523  ORF Transcript_30652/g.5523 Transcript_30652/m.5523 type:complete len:83 (+) Transcript_30652:2211-2459(+)
MILTTHSMEEAEVLSDRIAVIVDGQIKVIGNSLTLKKMYGDGYRMVFNSNNPEGLKEKIAELMPEANLIDESGGSLMYVLTE